MGIIYGGDYVRWSDEGMHQGNVWWVVVED